MKFSNAGASISFWKKRKNGQAAAEGRAQAYVMKREAKLLAK
jgi:hypothetical protein